MAGLREEVGRALEGSVGPEALAHRRHTRHAQEGRGRSRTPHAQAGKRARHSSTRGTTLRGGGTKLVRGIGDSAGFVVAERKRARREAPE